MAFILLAFASGTARIHRSFHARFERIIDDRNEKVRELRRQAP